MINDQLDEQDELLDVELELDPGQLEGTQDDPSDAITEEHPRFKKIYGKMKHLERELKEVSERSEAQIKAIDGMKEHNKNMASSMNSVQAETKQIEQPAPPVIDTSVLEKEIADAFEEGDYGKASGLQAKLFKTMMASIKVPSTEEIASAVKTASGNTANDMAFYDWKKGNDWYDSNSQARVFADARGQELNNAGTLSYEQVLAKVAEETKDIFKITEDSRALNQPAVDEGNATEGDRHSAQGNKLTTEQKELAKLFDMSDADMLKQVKYGAKGVQNA